ncbi:site-specific integrase [Streptomyces sp. 35G-GA-8]|uniref:tyrosine-type recombinase/integrase n=1 Tax=Streptomyces sp. 35G-GA-8 TaxID=2939434 RepID=UPI00201EC7AD|nr:site-specific integrase [Streptomyces sp. 35G-GA-8]MCL7377049.1 site-specific integrase [Streptomyces sp. 35G-GA-8]
MAWVERRGTRWRVRYWNENGTAATAATFDNETEARTHADTLTTTTKATADATSAVPPEAPSCPLPPATASSDPLPEPDTWTGPRPVRQETFEAWALRWWETIEVGPNTAAGYRSLFDNHLRPRWGHLQLNDITPTAVTLWFKQLRDTYKPTTVAAIGKLFSLILSAAVRERLIPANPVRIPRSRGRIRRDEIAWADEHQVLAIARRSTHLGNTNLGLLIITAAYTGMRWGELAALRRDAVTADATALIVHPDHGALHEINGHHSYGPPKTAASDRTITLPPFLTDLITQNLRSHQRDHVFTTVTGRLLRRSVMQRRYWAPAVNGTTLTDNTVWKPIKPGLTFHGLRHSHKTWLIEDGIPDVAQARRLGHTLPNQIDDIYSHVATKLNDRILEALESRWHRSVEAARRM